MRQKLGIANSGIFSLVLKENCKYLILFSAKEHSKV